MAQRTISLGLAKVEIGEVAESGMQTTLTQMGYTYKDSFTQTTNEPDVTDYEVEEVDIPIEQEGQLGSIVYEWDILDPDVSEMAATGGGTADSTNDQWESPDGWTPIEKAFVFTPKKGFVHKVPRASVIAYPSGGFKKGSPQLWHMKATVLKNAGAAPRILKRIAGAVAAPTFSPASWASGNSLTVYLTCATAGATIYYTTDGTTPTSSSTAYTSSGISLSATSTIKAIAVKSGMADSSVVSKTYTKP